MSLIYERELSSEVVDSGIKFPTSIRQPHARCRLAAFLEGSPLFDSDKREWRDMPKSPQHGLDLYDAIFTIFRAICSEFGCAKLSPTSRSRRGLACTRNTTETVNIERLDKSTYSLRVTPAVVLTGIGPNFPLEELQIHDPNLFCVIPLELKVEDDWDDVKLQVQAFVYARYVTSPPFQPTQTDLIHLANVLSNKRTENSFLYS